MARQRHHYTADFKATVALAAIKGQHTVNELATTYGVHPKQVLPWKKQALEALPDGFSSRRARAAQDDETWQARLYQQIGQLKVELDWLKKSWRVHVSRDGHGLTRTTSRAACGGNVSGSARTTPDCTTSQW
jgi:transposase-like protein